MRIKKFGWLIIFLVFIHKIHAEEVSAISMCGVDRQIGIKDVVFLKMDLNRPNPLYSKFQKQQQKNSRAVAAALAFPFPFGIVGLHRIYLGSAPYVPIVYIGTIGGAFGILPFIDFCMLILDKDIDRYIDNKKVFMWAE
jgi:TM2 domain-containing membrane protein YozV